MLGLAPSPSQNKKKNTEQQQSAQCTITTAKKKPEKKKDFQMQSLVLDPEGSLSAATHELLQRQFNLSPLILFRAAVIFLEKRTAAHVHRVVERATASQEHGATLDQIVARIRPLAAAVQLGRRDIDHIHPFREGLIRSDALLLLSTTTDSALATATALRSSLTTMMLVSWHERRLRVEIPQSVSFDTSAMLIAMLRAQIDVRYSSSSSGSDNISSLSLGAPTPRLGTSAEERDLICKDLCAIFARVEAVARLKKNITRAVIGAALAILGVALIRFLLKWHASSAIIRQRSRNVADAQGPSSSPPACTICLETMVQGGGEPLLACSCQTHVFHYSCLEKWFSNHQTCPLCRQADPDLALALIAASPMTASSLLGYFWRFLSDSSQALSASLVLLPFLLRLLLAAANLRSLFSFTARPLSVEIRF